MLGLCTDTASDGAPSLCRAILDSMLAHIAVLDRQGIIVAVNEPWVRFGIENSPASASSPNPMCVGADYLAACAAHVGEGGDGSDDIREGASAREGILAVLRGEIPRFQMEYPCHSPAQQRWFMMSVSPLRSAEGGAVVSHIDITDRKLGETAVAEAVESKRILFGESQDGIAVIDANHRVLEANPRFAAMLGYAPEEMTGMAIWDWEEQWSNPGAVQARFAEPLQQSRLFETRHRRKDGTALDVEVMLLSASWCKQPVVFAISRDISARKFAEKALRESEERFRQLAERTRDIFWVTEWPDQRVTYVSPAFETISGIPTAALYRDPDAWAKAIHPEDRAEVRRQFTEGLKNGRFDIEYRIVRPDGDIRWIKDIGSTVQNSEGQVYRVVGIVRDITQRRRMLEELDRHRHHLEHLVTERTEQLREANRALLAHAEEIADLYNNAPCGYHSLGPDGSVMSINDTELAWLGYARQAVVGKPFADLLTPKSARAFRATFPRFKQTGKLVDQEYDLVRKDGTVISVLLNSMAILGERGEFLMSRSTLFDNSERKARDLQIARLNAELAQRAAEAEEASRAKSVFLANMSHEIRTPMSSILGLADLCLGMELTERQRNYLEKIRRASDTLLRIINDILDFSKIEAGKLTLERMEFNLDQTLDSLATLLVDRAEKRGLELIFDTDETLPATLVGDPLRLSQILVNLVGNAIKFSEHGDVVVRVQAANRREDGLDLQVAVSDQGIGLTTEQQSMLFSAFSQADSSTTRRFGGTGLGLAISKRLVETMGGQIRVDSVYGRGSTFHFTIPLGVTGAPANPPLPAGWRAACQDRKALLVEGNDAARRILARRLAALGIGSDAYPSATAALSATTRMGAHPPLCVLVNMKTPGLDWIGFIRSLRDRFGPDPRVPIIPMAPHGQTAQPEPEGGMDHALAKPVTFSQLRAELLSRLGFAEPIPRPEAPCGDAEVSELAARLAGADILVVEDTEINREMMADILENLGLRPRLADNGREALKAVEASVPDAVLMDCQMPIMDGYEASRELRKQAHLLDLPIVALTAHAMASDRERCLAAGMNAYLSKPVDIPELLKVLAQWVKPRTRPAQRPERTPPPRTETATLLPDLPGIDIHSGLERTGGNPQLYPRLLRKFRDTHCRDFEADFRAALANGDTATAQRLAHSLKGVSRSLGINQLGELAADLELAMKQGRTDLDGRLQALTREIGFVADGLAALRDPGTDAAPRPQPDAGAFRAEALRLEELLDTHDVSAIACFEGLSPMLATRADPSTLAEIRRHLDRYDFERVLVLLRKITRSEA